MTLPSHPNQTDDPAPTPEGNRKWIPIVVVGLVIAMTMLHLLNGIA